MGYSPWMRPRHSNTLSVFLCRFSCNLSSWKWSSLITCCCARLIQKSLHAVISCVDGGPWIFSKGCWQLRMKPETHAQTLRALCRSNLSSTWSRSWLILIAAAKIFHWTFLSASLFWLACVMISSGQLVRSANHSGPLHHSCTSVTLPPRLPRSAGFSVEGTWCHWVFGWLSHAICDGTNDIHPGHATSVMQLCYPTSRLYPSAVNGSLSIVFRTLRSTNSLR